MEEAATYAVGEHDFTTFTNAKSKKKSMVRRIDRIEIIPEDDYLVIEFEGNGFLHNMVRRLVGTFIQIGLNELSPKKMKSFIDAKDRQKISYVAESKGLFLERVNY